MRNTIIAGTLGAFLACAGCTHQNKFVSEMSEVYEAPTFSMVQKDIYNGREAKAIKKTSELFGVGEEKAREYVTAQKTLYDTCEKLEIRAQDPWPLLVSRGILSTQIELYQAFDPVDKSLTSFDKSEKTREALKQTRKDLYNVIMHKTH